MNALLNDLHRVVSALRKTVTALGGVDPSPRPIAPQVLPSPATGVDFSGSTAWLVRYGHYDLVVEGISNGQSFGSLHRDLQTKGYPYGWTAFRTLARRIKIGLQARGVDVKETPVILPPVRPGFSGWVREHGYYDEVMHMLRDGVLAREIYGALEPDGVPIKFSSFEQWCNDERKKLGINGHDIRRKVQVAA